MFFRRCSAIAGLFYSGPRRRTPPIWGKSIAVREAHRQKQSRGIVRHTSVVLWLKAGLKALRGNGMNKGYWVVAYRKVLD